MSDSARIQSGLSSLRGNKDKNDDYAVIDEMAHFCAIADGIGGARDGDYISRIACGASLNEYERSGSIIGAFRCASMAATQVSNWLRNPQCGSTLLLAELAEARMRFVGVGDTAAFRLRADRFERITPLGRNVDDGHLESAIGYANDCAPFDRTCSVKLGDRFLLCTDGVWETYTTSDISLLVENLRLDGTPSSIAARIVSGAKLVGTQDDATAIVICVDSSGF